MVAVKITTLPTGGTLLFGNDLVLAGDEIGVADLGYLRWEPAANATGSFSFTFQVKDAGSTLYGGANIDPTPNVFTFRVLPVNDAPSGKAGRATILEDGRHVFDAADFGFVDAVEGHAMLGVTITTLPGSGTLKLGNALVSAGQFVTVANIRKLVWTPDKDANGRALASFTFQVVDKGGTANGGINTDPIARRFTFDVTAVNDAPSGKNGTVTLREDGRYAFKAKDFGMSDVDGHTLKAVKISSIPSTGIMTFNGKTVKVGQTIKATDLGKLVWSPPKDANGNVSSFTFQVIDSGGTRNGGVDTDQSPNRITFSVTPVNDAPVAQNDAAEVRQFGSVAGNVISGPAGRDTDVDGDALTVIKIAGGTVGKVLKGKYGTLKISADGSYTYKAIGADTLSPGITVKDTFTYTVSDGNGGAARAKLVITVTSADAAAGPNDGHGDQSMVLALAAAPLADDSFLFRASDEVMPPAPSGDKPLTHGDDDKLRLPPKADVFGGSDTMGVYVCEPGTDFANEFANGFDLRSPDFLI